ncbi:beta-lactamase family protein [Paraconexibacter antarcticus]|uniref:Beta-lactamase family protein n=1 Tax=Paraconexibacter antarcticus TaxID=2949664 RepID=A0ABY5E0K8_9ACTN|nr:serine hydrolase domain-containing protein [Paraconexibacter antarcticus]UTI66734.1 beta-lactamase family protein [Paraconexibacter antarcticus]
MAPENFMERLHTVDGSCDPRFARVREEFERNFAERGELGASVCVIVDGEPVVDLWGGIADERDGRPWQRDTMNVVMSCSKGLTAICGNMLIDRGELDPDAPVARYWPEFAQAGKADIPVRMVFNHQSGVAHVDERVPPGGINDYELMVALVERTTPFWTPGTRAGYHGLTVGWLVGELVRRVSGRTVGTFFREEVAEPLGLTDCWIGLPEAQEHRVARSIPFELPIPELPPAAQRLLDPTGRAFRVLSRVAAASPAVQRRIARELARHVDAADLPPNLMARLAQLDPLLFALMGNMGDWLPDHFDTPVAHAAEVPAGGAVANARGLAGAYTPLALGGTVDGVRLVSADGIARMRHPQSVHEIDAVLGIRTSYTMGFSKSWPNPGVADSSVIIGEDAFGTPGMGGQMGFADPAYRLAFGYTMNRHGVGTALNARGQSLIDATYEILGSRGRKLGFWARPSS